MKPTKEQLIEELEKDISSVVKYAKECDVESLDKCFDILIKNAKENITRRSVEWYTHYNGTYNSTVLIENTMREVNAICELYKVCKSEFNNAYAKNHGAKVSKRTAKDIQAEHELNNLEIHKLAQKMSTLYLETMLGDISFKSVEKYNENLLKQPGNN